jgi:hypothetical protein
VRKTFHILVAPQFDQCGAFADGIAEACVDCVAHCIDEACHGKTMSGGRGVALDTSGRIRRRFAIGEHHSTPLPDPSTSTGAR